MADSSSSSSDFNTVEISGMFGEGRTYFANNPVIITVEGLEFPSGSPIKVCRVRVLDSSGSNVGEFSADVGNESSISFDISSALRAIWADYNTFSAELQAAMAALGNNAQVQSVERDMRTYSLEVETEYVSDDGVYTTTSSGIFPGGQCVIGGRTEYERSLIDNIADADVAALEHDNPRNGDASTKPRTSPEIVGLDSITSFVDFVGISDSSDSDSSSSDEVLVQTQSYFYPARIGGDGAADSDSPHAPIVLRDNDVPYIDFLFINRRGAMETCSAQMLEAMDINVEVKQYVFSGKPTYQPSRRLMAIASGGRRSWSMSSGYQTREWAEWWTMEFLMARQWWMRYPIRPNGIGPSLFWPVTVAPAKKSTSIYDHTKQQMPSVEFTVTLAVEG